MTKFEEKDENGLPTLFKLNKIIPSLNLNSSDDEAKEKIGKTFKKLKVIDIVGTSKSNGVTWFEVRCIDCNEMQLVSNEFLNVSVTDPFKYDCNCQKCWEKKIQENFKEFDDPNIKKDDLVDLVGKRFNNFEVIKNNEVKLDGVQMYSAKCGCGNISIMSLEQLNTHVDYHRDTCFSCSKSSSAVENVARRLRYDEYTPHLNMDKQTFDLMFKRIRITNQRIRKLDDWLLEEKTNFKIVGFRTIEKSDKACKVVVKCKHCGDLSSITKYKWDKLDKDSICDCQKAVWNKPLLNSANESVHEEVNDPKPSLLKGIAPAKIDEPYKPSTLELKEDLKNFVEFTQTENNTNIFSGIEVPSRKELKEIKSKVTKEYCAEHPVILPKELLEKSENKEPEVIKQEVQKESKDEPIQKFNIDLAFTQLIEALKQLGVNKETILSFVHVSEDIKNNNFMSFNVDTKFEKSNHITMRFKNLLALRSSYFEINVNYFIDPLNKRVVLCINSFDKVSSFVDKIEIKILPKVN